MPQEESADQMAVIKLPADLHQQVKIQAILHRREMQDISAEAIREWLKRHAVAVESSLAGGK